MAPDTREDFSNSDRCPAPGRSSGGGHAASVHDWGALTGPELAALAKRDPVAICPVAAVEQHGPHLPLDTDVIIGEGLLNAALQRWPDALSSVPLLRLPTLRLGSSLEHAAFPGTLTLSAEQMMSVLRAVGSSVAAAGIRRLVFFNSHGGNRAPIDMAALQLRSELGLFVVKAHYFRFVAPDGLIPTHERAHGLHGGAMETALMHYFAPGAVRQAALDDFESLGARRARDGHTIGPEGDAAFAWCAQDLNPRGVTGDAASADAEIGRQLTDAFATRLVEILGETARFELSDSGSALC